MKNLLLIDANSLIHRAFHALPPLTNNDGEVVQAIYGISTILLKLWKEDQPEYAAALFDLPGKTFRDEKYSEYKAQRQETPAELSAQIDKIPELFKFWGIKSFSKTGFEADDLIATFAEKFKTVEDLRIEILTGDMDATQLVEGEKVVVKAFKKGVSETVIYDERGVKERFNLRPEQIVDYKALVGDNSDNIKGVPGIGPKTACSLLNEYGTLEEALKKMPESKTREKLISLKDQFDLSKELVTLVRDVPVDINGLEDISVSSDYEGLAKFFEKQGFKTLLARLTGEKKPDAQPEKTISQGQIF